MRLIVFRLGQELPPNNPHPDDHGSHTQRHPFVQPYHSLAGGRDRRLRIRVRPVRDGGAGHRPAPHADGVGSVPAGHTGVQPLGGPGPVRAASGGRSRQPGRRLSHRPPRAPASAGLEHRDLRRRRLHVGPVDLADRTAVLAMHRGCGYLRGIRGRAGVAERAFSRDLSTGTCAGARPGLRHAGQFHDCGRVPGRRELRGRSATRAGWPRAVALYAVVWSAPGHSIDDPAAVPAGIAAVAQSPQDAEPCLARASASCSSRDCAA